MCSGESFLFQHTSKFFKKINLLAFFNDAGTELDFRRLFTTSNGDVSLGIGSTGGVLLTDAEMLGTQTEVDSSEDIEPIQVADILVWLYCLFTKPLQMAHLLLT